MDHHTLFSDKSDVYAASRPSYPQELYDTLLSACVSNELVWDCACGNGQAAVDLADRFECVHATDISPEQIANAVVRSNINYEVAPSEQCSLPDESCDLICVAQALHWFDYDEYWPEAIRVLKPNGVFAAWGYNWPVLEPALAHIFKSEILNVIEPYWAEQNKLIWNHYRDISFPFDPIRLPKSSMAVDHNFAEFTNFIHTFSAVRRCIDENGDQFFKEACAKLGKAWGDLSERKSIAFDFVLYVGRKSA